MMIGSAAATGLIPLSSTSTLRPGPGSALPHVSESALLARALGTSGMSGPAGSPPDELAALTKPLEPAAKRVPKKQLKDSEKVSAPRTHAMASRRSGACTDLMGL